MTRLARLGAVAGLRGRSNSGLGLDRVAGPGLGGSSGLRSRSGLGLDRVAGLLELAHARSGRSGRDAGLRPLLADDDESGGASADGRDDDDDDDNGEQGRAVIGYPALCFFVLSYFVTFRAFVLF